MCVVRLGVEEEEEGRVQAEFGCLGKLQSKVLRLLLQALVLKLCVVGVLSKNKLP